MKKAKLVGIVVSLILLGSCSTEKGFFTFNKKQKAEIQTDNPQGIMEWEYERVKNPTTGQYSLQTLVNAYNQQQSENIRRGVIPGVKWTERGPNNVGGRTRAIIFDKNDATSKTVFAASVAGGLFKCTDIYATTPTWVSQNDFFTNLAIVCMVQNQNSPDTIYFGTGEGFGNTDGLRGAGIWRSINGGVSWTQLPSIMGGSVPYYVTRMGLNNAGHIYASTNNGLFKSTNGGNSWVAELTTTTVPATANNVGLDLKIAANGDVYYSNKGELWQMNVITGAWNEITPAGTFKRIEIACAPSNDNYVYIMCQDSATNGLKGWYSSVNKGTTWANRGLPKIYDQNSSPIVEMSRNQAWYDLSLVVDPNNSDIVYAGAIDYIKSTDNGATYKQISAWSLYDMPGAAKLDSQQIMHSDQHIMVFKPGSSDTALFGGDGGIYRSMNLADSPVIMPKYSAINTDYNVTQYFSCAMANVASSNNFLAGTQDNGTHKFTTKGINAVSEVTGGDGAFCFIDQANPSNQISSYTRNNYYYSTNGVDFKSISGSDKSGYFINPADFDGVNDILYSAGGPNTFRRWKNVFSSSFRTDISLNSFVGNITCIKVSPNNPTTVYFGTKDGNIYKLTSANTVSSPATPVKLTVTQFGGRISCINIRENGALSDDTMVITLSNFGLGNSVILSTNATAVSPTFKNIDDNNTLPDMPINWSLFAPTNQAKELLLATELGIYTCDDIFASTPTWGQSNNGFANVRVDMLQYRKADSLIIAATHGRGLFSTDKYSAPRSDFKVNKKIAYTGVSLQFSEEGSAATSWAWDFDNDGTTDATIQNPTFVYTTPGLKTVKLSINGGAYTKTVADYINILPNMAVPYTLAQGGDFESNASDFASDSVNGVFWERGNSLIVGKDGVRSGSNAWVTGLLDAAYSNKNETYLYTPNFDLSNAGLDTMRFFLKGSFENGYDGVRVEYSLNKGSSWIPLGTSIDSNWYNFVFPSNFRSFPVNEAAFTGDFLSYTAMKYSISSLFGNANVAFRFAMKGKYGNFYPGCAIDNFEITHIPINTTIETAVTSKAENFGPNATVVYYSPDGNLMARLINNSSHDYGATTVSIDNAGSGAMNYFVNTDVPKKIAQKTFTVSPTFNNPSGNYTAKFYYTQAELAGWRTATGNGTADGSLFKCPTDIASGTLTNATYCSSPGFELINTDDTAIVGTFSTGFSGFGFGSDVFPKPTSIVKINIKLVPQPAYNTLQVTTNLEDGFGYSIFNLSGAEILKGQIDKLTGNIDISKLPKGSYIIQVSASGKEKQSLKFMKVE